MLLKPIAKIRKINKENQMMEKSMGKDTKGRFHLRNLSHSSKNKSQLILKSTNNNNNSHLNLNYSEHMNNISSLNCT